MKKAGLLMTCAISKRVHFQACARSDAAVEARRHVDGDVGADGRCLFRLLRRAADAAFGEAVERRRRAPKNAKATAIQSSRFSRTRPSSGGSIVLRSEAVQYFVASDTGPKPNGSSRAASCSFFRSESHRPEMADRHEENDDAEIGQRHRAHDGGDREEEGGDDEERRHGVDGSRR